MPQKLFAALPSLQEAQGDNSNRIREDLKETEEERGRSDANADEVKPVWCPGLAVANFFHIKYVNEQVDLHATQ